MAVPKKKTSKSKRDMRSSNKALVKKSHISFDESGKPTLSHMRIKPKRIKKEKMEEEK